MSEVDEQTPDQYFTAGSREALAEASRRLTERLQAHTEALLAMRGGPDEQTALLEQNAALEELVEGWNDAVYEHTGSSPLVLEDELDDDDEDEADEEEVEEPDQLLSVVSRFDLRVVDPAALLEAGRAAQQRHPVEADETPEPVETAEQAVYELSRELGETWFALPGVDLVAGARAYVVPEEPFEPLDADADAEDIRTQVGAPDGTVTHAETWS